ncbi:MAG: hypothetical protein K5879_00290 [Lachnospiraceae bacterium]|nr:hypothetical protein [Lachnospiraceae bacterium]
MLDLNDSIELNNLGIRENQVRLDYSQAMNTAINIENIAKNIRAQMKGEFDGVINGIHLAWEGENADRFCNKCNTTSSTVDKTVSDLLIVADKIQIMAKNTLDAELKAIDVARDRIYNK